MEDRQTGRRRMEPDVWAGRGVDIDRDEVKDRGGIKGGRAKQETERRKII